jgi:hypothetical protein
MQKREPGGSRFCYFRFVVLAARALLREFRVSDAHRMRGVIS